MSNSLRIKLASPSKTDQSTMKQDTASKDAKPGLPKLSMVNGPNDSITSPKKSDRRTGNVSASIDNKDEIIRYLTMVKRSQLMQSDRYRNATNSPIKKQSPRFQDQEIRLYPGITEHGMRRLLNNTFARINREQALLKTLDARRRKEVLKKLSIYDEMPIQRILREKHMETVMNGYHGLENVPDIKINELRMERMLRKLDKMALSLKLSKKKSPRSFLEPKGEGLPKSDRFEPNFERTFLTKPVLEESFPVDRSLPLPSGVMKASLQSSSLENTDMISLKHSYRSKNPESLQAQYANVLSRKRSKSALPSVKLSAMNIVQDIFPTRHLESFINENFETTVDSTRYTTKNVNYKLPTVLGSKKGDVLNETIAYSDRYATSSIKSSGRVRVDRNMPLKGITWRRGEASSKRNKLSSSLEREELSGIFENYQKDLKWIQQRNNNDIKALNNYHNYLNNDHEKLKKTARRVVPLKHDELARELEAIRFAVVHETQAKKKVEEAETERRLNRLNMLGERALLDGIMKLDKKEGEENNRNLKGPEKKLKILLQELDHTL